VAKLRTLCGRPLLIEGRTLHFGIKNRLFRFADGEIVAGPTIHSSNPLLSSAPRLIDRLLRNEISLLRRLGDGSLLAVYRKGFYLAQPGEGQFNLKCSISRGSRPLGMSVENQGWMVYGEYGSLPRDQPVHIYGAQYPSFRFESVHCFPAGSVKHVHNVQWDTHAGCYWVLVGDSDEESGILRLSADFKSAEWLVRGSQMARAVNLFVTPDELLYATDSERDLNRILSVDKQTGVIKQLLEMPSSSLGAARMAGRYYVSTAVEPSVVNKTGICRLFESADGADWKEVLGYPKDVWHPTYFQFGSLVLPHAVDAQIRVVGGQAVRDLDGRFVILDDGSSA